jgi:transposase
MKPLTISDAETMILALQDEIHRSEDARYDHRLHALLLVAQGMSCREVAGKLGDSPRIVAYWVKQFEEIGFAGLSEGERPGRPSRLSEEQFDEIGLALRKSPLDYGLATNIWDGKTLSEYIQKKWSVEIGVRQCQRMFRRLGFRLRKPRSMIAHSDPEEQEAFKKTS